MTKENLEKAQAALDNLEAHRKLLATIKASGAIAIGPAHEVSAQSTDIIGGHHLINHHFSGGMVIGLKSDFFANPRIREACTLFHKEMTRILEDEVAILQSKFESL